MDEPEGGFRIRLKRKVGVSGDEYSICKPVVDIKKENDEQQIMVEGISRDDAVKKKRSNGPDLNPLTVVYSEQKKYQAAYMWGQLSGWYKQTVADPSASLSAERRGTMSLPDLTSCFGGNKDRYKDRKKIIDKVKKTPFQMWPTGTIWSFKNPHKIYGSPWLDKAFMKSSKNLDECLKEIQANLERKYD
mmetsp:Transcript_3604/g.4526  ORF Transcript_3604/g.4526 Transcript_3604/m.4526 type:complete len:189 (+) Transcript_3604:2-568(+)